jgi:adenylate cyclase 8
MHLAPPQSARYRHSPTAFISNYFKINSIHLCCAGFVGEGIGFAKREYLVWYILFILFVPYAMLPLPLKWCMVGGMLTATTHIIITTIAKFQQTQEEPAYIDSSCVIKQMVANSLLYVAINFAGMYTKYLTDRGQRLAFIETHKAMEHKKESEKEYQKTQRLLDSSEY